MNPSVTGVKVKSKGQHPFPGEVKRSWCFCSFSQMVKTESKVKIPSAELVASLTSFVQEFEFYHNNYYATPISCSITTPSYIMRMLARKKGFSPHPYLHHWIELLQSWIKLYSCDIRFGIRRIPALLSSSKARGVVWMSCNRSRDFRTQSRGQGRF